MDNTELEEFKRTTRTMLTKVKNYHPESSSIRMTLPERGEGCELIDMNTLHANQETRLRGSLLERRNNLNFTQSDRNYSQLKLVSDAVSFSFFSFFILVKSHLIDG